MNAPMAAILPRQGTPVTMDSLMNAERQLAEIAVQTDNLDQIEEWRSQARALEQYLSTKKLHAPMQGAQRRLEARIGQLLGEAQVGANQHHGGVTYAESLERPADRHDFRLLARALSGDIALTDDEWRQSRRGLVHLIKQRISETEAMSVVEIDPDETSASAYNGSHINVPEGQSAETITRQGIAFEKEGISSVDAASRINVGERTYRQMRDIVTLADRDALSARDRDAAQSALHEMNETRRIGAAYERIEPIVIRVWGSRRNGPRDVIEANRLANFERAFGVVIQACSGGAGIDVPYLTEDRTTEAVAELKEAERHLRALRARIEEIHQ